MKTRFSDILKIKKQKLDEIERQLQDVQHRKKILKEQILGVDAEIVALKIPQEGNFAKMQLSREAFDRLRQDKEELLERLTLRENQLVGLKELYQEAMIEYEKMVYLNNEEIKKVLKLRAQEESKALDEIANILFVNKKEKEEV